MPGAQKLPGVTRAQLAAWYYLDGETLVNPDDDALTLPSTCSAVTISCEGGVCYYAINGAIAGTTSPGYIAEEGMQSIGPVANLTGIRVHAPAATLHVTYWREA